MRRLHRIIATAALWSILMPCASADPGGPGVKRAVLIGINNYLAVQPLKGSINDVMTMREILIKRWGFEAQRITLLTEQQATRDNILAALARVVRESEPEDTVYIHYSGHGSQVEDLNGDEADGLDETLVPQNGRTPGIRDIVDDELDELFAKFRTRNVLIVLDSCHSGTATRSFDIRARSVPQDRRIELYREAPKSRAIVSRMETRFVVMSATSEKDEALDGPIEGRYHGFFSYALANSLSSAATDATARQIFNGALQELKRVQGQFGRLAMPEPQLEAPPTLLDKPLLGLRLQGDAPAAAPRLTWAQVRATGSDVILVNGAILGATPGATWSIYPPNETGFAAGDAIALAVVGQISGDDALATLISRQTQIPFGSRAVAALRAGEPLRISIRVQAANELRRRQIRDLLFRNSAALDFVGPQAAARFIIEASSSGIKLMASDGLQTVGEFEAKNDKWPQEAVRIMLRSLTASELLSLDNPAAQLQVSAAVVANAQPGKRDIVLAVSTQPSILHVRAENELRATHNSLQLAVSTSKDAYLTIVDVDAEGGVNLLFPNAVQRQGYMPDGFVRAGATTLIPDSIAADNAAGFYWDYSPPLGADTVRIFACAQLACAAAIRRRIGSLKPGSGNAEALLALRTDLQELMTRGIRLEASTQSGAPADWAAAAVSVLIQD